MEVLYETVAVVPEIAVTKKTRYEPAIIKSPTPTLCPLTAAIYVVLVFKDVVDVVAD